MRQYSVGYRSYRTNRDAAVLVTVRESAGTNGLWYATAPGAGCSKDYDNPAHAARYLVEDDLGQVFDVLDLTGVESWGR